LKIEYFFDFCFFFRLDYQGVPPPPAGDLHQGAEGRRREGRGGEGRGCQGQEGQGLQEG